MPSAVDHMAHVDCLDPIVREDGLRDARMVD